jgi:hypothetical protein
MRLVSVLAGFLLVTGGLLGLPRVVTADSSPTGDQRNNPIGINVIRWTENQYLWAASDLVNSAGGDWGYITITLVDQDRNDPSRLQRILNQCAHRHLTPIIRVATRFDLRTATWSRPEWDGPYRWRELFSDLQWPTTLKYVVVGNEPNLGREWGGEVDPGGYARYLDKWLEAFADDPSFRIFNGALDASNDTSMPDRMDEFEFIDAMREEVPSLVDRLHGWASNPYHFWWGTEARFTYKAYEAELDYLGRDMPVIVMEFHAFEIDEPRMVAEYYAEAYDYWLADPRIIAITPFFWNPESDSFWMYQVNPDGTVADASPTYHWLRSLPKRAGSPKFHPPLANTARPTLDVPTGTGTEGAREMAEREEESPVSDP